MYKFRYAIFLGWALLAGLNSHAQEPSRPVQQTVEQDQNASTQAPSDSTDIENAPPKGDIETTIEYASFDSIYMDVVNRWVYLYGDAQVDYGTTSLKADRIIIDYTNNTVQANGRIDSLGKKIGYPVFTQDGKQYNTDTINYNFKTDRALIKGVVTQEGEAYMHGKNVVKNDQDELFIKHAKYTTCNLAEPHFHIQSDKIKMIQDDKLVSGPFNLYVNNVPTPLGFAFGMFPAPKERVSGVIIPEPGEEKRRGFFLRDAGYFLKINDYITTEFLGSIYSKGSYGLSMKTDYKKRYAYNGSFSFRYNKNAAQKEFLDNSSTDFWVNWNHQPVSRGTSRFSANVSAGSSSYNTNNPQSISDMTKATFNSNVSYSKNFQGTPFNLAVNFRHTQNVRDTTVDLTLPQVSFNMNRIYPLRGLSKSGGKSWYENLSVAYNMQASNKISNRSRQPNLGFNIANYDTASYEQIKFNLDNANELYNRMQNGIRHSIPINTSLKILKHFQATAAFNYDEIWYDKELAYEYIPELEAVRVDTLRGFSRTGSWSASAGLNTRLYGFFNISKDGPVKAVRHMMTPAVSFSYRPDRSDYGLNEVQINEEGETKSISSYQGSGFVYGTPSGMESGNINFSLTNNIEMKVRDKSDTTGSGYKKVPLLDNLSITTSYDVVDDDFNLSDIRLNARTSLFNQMVRLNLNSRIDPYTWVVEERTINETSGKEEIIQKRVEEFAWDNGQGLGTVTFAQLGVTTSLSPKSFQSNNSQLAEENDVDEDEMEYINRNPDMYVSWDVPWRLNMNYSLRYNRPERFDEAELIQSLNFSGDVNISEKWKIGFRSGYDFRQKDFSNTSFQIYRDLHCWDLRVNWTPFGLYQSFSLDLAVKASVLQDLKLSRRRHWRDN